jgi:uncharacterized phiE125 gp8 family phage protein
MGLTLITQPASFPVSLAEAKAHCRVEDAADDATLNGLIAAATDYVEQYTGKAIITQTWRLTLDEFSDSILLPKNPVQSVVSVMYYDSQGALQTLSEDDYTADLVSDPAWIVINANTSLPDLADGVNMVRINFVAGYTVVPPSIKHAILMLVAQWFDNRAAVADRAMIAVPHAVEALLTNYRNLML